MVMMKVVLFNWLTHGGRLLLMVFHSIFLRKLSYGYGPFYEGEEVSKDD